MSEYIVPTDARAEYRQMIQRANRRVLSNLKYLKENGIRDNQIKTMLAGDFSSKKKWATKNSPFSYKTTFKSEKAYREFMRYVSRWGEDTGKRGGYKADVKRIKDEYKTAIYKTINGLVRNKGISLEEWGGDLPPELKKRIESLSLEQLTHFFRYVDPSGEVEVFDSDQVDGDEAEDMIDYLSGVLSSLEKFYPIPAKKTTKKGKKRKSRRKTKGRK